MAQLPEVDDGYWVPVAEAAELARFPRRTIYEWIKQQRLTCKDFGQTLVNFDEVCELIELRSSAGRLSPLRRTA